MDVMFLEKREVYLFNQSLLIYLPAIEFIRNRQAENLACEDLLTVDPCSCRNFSENKITVAISTVAKRRQIYLIFL